MIFRKHCLIAALCFALLLSPKFDVSQINDRPLLTPEQQKEAIENDRIAFDCAGVHYVIENSVAVILKGFLTEYE